MACSAMVNWKGSDQSKAGLDDLGGLFQSKWICDSVISFFMSKEKLKVAISFITEIKMTNKLKLISTATSFDCVRSWNVIYCDIFVEINVKEATNFELL